MVKNLPAVQETGFDPWLGRSPGGGTGRFPGGGEQEDPLEGGNRKIPRRGTGRSPGGVTGGTGKDHPLQGSSLENARGRGAWQAAAHGVANSRT